MPISVQTKFLFLSKNITGALAARFASQRMGEYVLSQEQTASPAGIYFLATKRSLA